MELLTQIHFKNLFHSIIHSNPSIVTDYLSTQAIHPISK